MKPKFSALSFLLGLIILLTPACEPDDPPPPPNPSDKIDLTPYELTLSPNFPNMPIPEDNPLTVAKVDLGKKLFYDPILSVDYSISCNSCHLQEHSFADPNRFSLGVNDSEGLRQAMPLFNLGYGAPFFWDGRATTLEEQALMPIEDPLEMKNTVSEVINRISDDTVYVNMFHKAFGKDPDAEGLAKALASFERTIISDDAPYDKYLRQEQPLTPSQQRGWLIFNGEVAECFHCHNGHNNTTFEFTDNGLQEEYKDMGLFTITGKEEDKGKFKVPSLRNLKYTAPYMHDGRFETLEEVIEFYMSGGNNTPNQNPLIRPFNLNAQEQQDLLNFLLALSDEEFVVDEQYK
jgi:cytochrome c peroxidase